MNFISPQGAGRLALCLALAASASYVAAHENAEDDSRHDNKNLLHAPDNPDGHVPKNVNYGFELLGVDNLGGIATGRYTDVWAHDGFAYIGTFQEPTCDNSGVYVSDIRDPFNPTTVHMLKSPANTRINDVKVHEIGGKAILFVTYEPCGLIRNGLALGDGQNVRGDNDAQGNNQKGVGGIGLYDVSTPTNPKPLQKFYLDSPIHNTFSWTRGDGRSFTLAVDDVALNDLWIVETTDPKKPVVLAQTGIGDWLVDGQAPQIAADGQLFTGAFAAPLLHDVWVEDLDPGEDENWVALLPYWDAGFVTLDVNDPANPIFLRDSTYPAVDPVLGISPMEGNAHAAVFGEAMVESVGAPVQMIYGGDEDFDSFSTGVVDDGAEYSATQGSDTPPIGFGLPIESLTGIPVSVGLACGDGLVPPAADPTDIALIERGVCSFTAKVTEVEAAGYAGAIVFNGDAPDRCEASVSMLVEGGIPAVFVARSAGFAMLDTAYDPADCGAGTTVAPAIGVTGGEITIAAIFDGWGYLHIINNTDQALEVKLGNAMNSENPTTVVRQPGEHIGYYAPAEVADPNLAVNAGDLTMHNIETDPTDRARMFISWYSLGMRAVEWREGHLHNPSQAGQSVASWNVHEVGRWIAEDGSNFWGVHVTEIDGNQVILGSDRNTGLHIFAWDCEGRQSDDPNLYCDPDL